MASAQPDSDDTTGIETPETPFEKRVGHHPGLFALFFAEMWERFSYYGMRALLVFYMTKDFLRYSDNKAYGVYGAYTALVYMTPFLGGLIADRYLGQRAAVVIGGTLMALGHLTMTLRNSTAFFLALALLILGNGFFKPNIGTIVGQLYSAERLKAKRDGAFTIFYMGVNLGAAMAPLLCGYIGETYGWHYGFGLATLGMIIGLAIFVAPTRVTQALVGAGALGSAGALLFAGMRQTRWVLGGNIFVAVALVVAMTFALRALANGGIPAGLGMPPDGQPGVQPGGDGPAPYRPVPKAMMAYPKFKQHLAVVLGGVAVLVPVFAWLVSHRAIAGYVLYTVGAVALGYVIFEAVRVTRRERERLFVILIMAFFSMLFWAFFEQAGSSINNFTDRNVDRVAEARVITAADVGRTLTIPLNQEQLGYPQGGRVFTLDQLDAARAAAQAAHQTEARAAWEITREHVGMGIGGSEVPASVFQATNPIYILLFGLVFTALWGALAKRDREPSTPTKFVMGLVQLGAGFGVLWYGAQHADGRGMVGMTWLLLAYLLHTTGELCLSPVGLSMVNKLSPKRMVATMLGAWYLATAFSQFLAGIIAQLTGVHEAAAGAAQTIPAPRETLGVYAEVFGKIAMASFVAAVLLVALTPFLKRWMHQDDHPAHPAG
jgi:POT family proton-dependent oligopeptide transporter